MRTRVLPVKTIIGVCFLRGWGGAAGRGGLEDGRSHGTKRKVSHGGSGF